MSNICTFLWKVITKNVRVRCVRRLILPYIFVYIVYLDISSLIKFRTNSIIVKHGVCFMSRYLYQYATSPLLRVVYRLEVVYYSSYIFPFRLGTQLPVLSYVVGIYLDQASVIGKLFCGSKLSFYHNVSHNYAQTWCLRRKPFRLSQWAFRLSSLSPLSIDCKRIVNARNCSWLWSEIKYLSFLPFVSLHSLQTTSVFVTEPIFSRTPATLIHGKTYEGWSNIYIRPHFVVCLCRQKANTHCILIYSSYYKTARKLLTNYHYLKSLYFSSHFVLLYLLNS